HPRLVPERCGRFDCFACGCYEHGGVSIKEKAHVTLLKHSHGYRYHPPVSKLARLSRPVRVKKRLDSWVEFGQIPRRKGLRDEVENLLRSFDYLPRLRRQLNDRRYPGSRYDEFMCPSHRGSSGAAASTTLSSVRQGHARHH